jgi:hypothetical protein
VQRGDVRETIQQDEALEGAGSYTSGFHSLDLAATSLVEP